MWIEEWRQPPTHTRNIVDPQCRPKKWVSPKQQPKTQIRHLHVQIIVRPIDSRRCLQVNPALFPQRREPSNRTENANPRGIADVPRNDPTMRVPPYPNQMLLSIPAATHLTAPLADCRGQVDRDNASSMTRTPMISRDRNPGTLGQPRLPTLPGSS